MACIEGLTNIEKIFRWFCIWHKRYNRKKNSMRKSGYIVDRPFDYSPSKYGCLKTHGFFDVKVYYRYGISAYLEKDGSFTVDV